MKCIVLCNVLLVCCFILVDVDLTVDTDVGYYICAYSCLRSVYTCICMLSAICERYYYILYLSSIYIKGNRARFVCVVVCMLLGDGGLLLCSGGFFFWVRSGGNDIFYIHYCYYAAGAFSLGSVLGPLLGNDI
jgi:hypothetical protein